MSRPLSVLREASNVVVILLILGAVAYLLDWATLAAGGTPFVGCTLVPAWAALTDTLAPSLALAGAVLWLWSGLRSAPAFWFCIAGLVMWLGPALLRLVLDPVCLA